MVAVINCVACKRELEETLDPSTGQRKPCPYCGELVHTVSGSGHSVGRSSAFAVGWDAQSPPTLLIQAVVTLGPKIPDGNLIRAVEPAWREIAKMIAADPNVMYQIHHRKLEELMAGWYKAYGFDEVILTPGSGDLGRDVIAIKHGVLSVRILDQVKAYKPGLLVPANDVRALLGVLGSDRGASKGLVTTTSDFAPGIETDPLIAPYIPTRLELVNGPSLAQRFRDIGAK